jgi:hypothetical protein
MRRRGLWRRVIHLFGLTPRSDFQELSAIVAFFAAQSVEDGRRLEATYPPADVGVPYAQRPER